jgi:hypothetical protein
LGYERAIRSPNDVLAQAFGHQKLADLQDSGKAPRIPGLKQIRKAFGGYDSAVEAASRHFDN